MKYFTTIAISIISCWLVQSAHAQTWGPSRAAEKGFDKLATLNKHYDSLSQAPDEATAGVIFKTIWQTWMIAPNADAAEVLNQAMRARSGYELDKAISILDDSIVTYPVFEQLFVERSFAYFIKKDYGQSLANCEKVLELDERHLGCLSGMARILIRHQQRYKAGKSLLDRAVAIHPFIFERVLYKEIPAAFL